MSDINQKATIELDVNGKPAEDELKKLRQQAKAYAEAMADAAKKHDNISYEKWRKEWRRVQKEIKTAESATKAVENVMTRLDKASPKELRDTLRTLEKHLNKIERGSQAWDAQVEKIRRVKAELNSVNDEIKQSESLWERAKRKFSEWGGSIVAVAGAFTGLAFSAKSAVDAYAEMEQEMANVRKFTGMDTDQVEELNEAFKKLDTRTSREDLNKLAQEAGRLGKQSKEDVLGFVVAANQINVALDDLGEGATLTLSKLTNIFGDEARLGTERSLLAVGSVINELSQNCTASAPYLADFSQRLAGVGAQAKMTIPQLMAFASVLDSQGQAVEMSATAFSQLIMKLYKDPAKFAKAANLDVKQFSDLLAKDANEAVLTLLESLNKMGGIQSLAPVLKEMKMDGARTSAVMAALAGNIDFVRRQQIAANEAFNEATSVTNEYNVQNTTVAAKLDKAKKGFHEMAVSLGQRLQPAMLASINATTRMVTAVSKVVSFAIEYKSALIALVAGIVAYKVAVNAANIATAVHYGWLVLCQKAAALWRGAVLLANAGLSLLTGNVERASRVMGIFNATVRANPLGVLLTAISAVVSIFLLFKTRLDNARKAQAELNKAVSDTNSAILSERNEIDKSFDALRKAKRGSEEYKEAKDKIISQYGQYLRGLVNEKNELIDIEAAYIKVKIAARDAAIARGMADAKKNVEDEFIKSDSDKMSKVEASLKKYLKDEGDLASIMQMIRDDFSKYGQISADTGKVIRESINKGRKENSWDVVRTAIYDAADNYKKFEQDIKDVETRFGYAVNEFTQYSEDELQAMFDDIQQQISDKSNKTFSIVAKGLFVGEYKTKAQAVGAMNRIEEALQMAKAKNKQTADVDDTDSATVGGGDDKKNKKDRFKVEDDWRTAQEAIARIALATGKQVKENGESAVYTVADYNKQMLEIEQEYIQKKLKHQDLTNAERLDLEAQYQESLAKTDKASLAKSVETEEKRHKSVVAQMQQMYVDGKIDKKTYDVQMEQYELIHLEELVKLSKAGSDERVKAEDDYRKALFKAAERRQKETEEAEKKHQQALDNIKKTYFGQNQAEKSADYAQFMSNLQSVYASELALAGDNATEKLRIELSYQQARLAMHQKYGKLVSNLSDDEVEALKKQIADLKKQLKDAGVDIGDDAKNVLPGWFSDMERGFSQMVSGMSAIFSQLTSLIQAEVDLQTAKIEKKYDREISAAEGNTYKVAKLEKKKEKEIAKLKNDANKKMFAMEVIQAVAQTAQNALAAYGSAAAIPVVGYILAPIAAAMAVAAGSMQVAAIKKQQQASAAQGYSKGGFTAPGDADQPAGIVHRGEWVASQKLVNSPRTRPIIDALERAQRTNTIGLFKDGGFASATPVLPLVQGADNSAIFAAVAVALSKFSASADRLNDTIDNGISASVSVTGDRGTKQANDYYDKLIKNKSK